jgi:hypothetical protein
MPLFILSLPLSFQTFWRYLLLLPLLAMFAIVFSLIAGLIPLFNYLVPGTVSAFFVICGLRCALTAHGHRNDQGTGQLLQHSVVFCVINAIAAAVIGLVVASGLKLVLAAVGTEGTAIGILSGWLGWSPYWTTLFVIGMLPYALYASAIAVPMTEAAAGGDHARSGIAVLFGAGAGLFSLTLVFMVWVFVGSLFSVFGEVWTMFAMIISALFAIMSAREIPWDWSLARFSLLGSTLFMTWASAWFYATAVLAWEQVRQSSQQARIMATEVNRASSGSLRAMREARDQTQRGSTGTT